MVVKRSKKHIGNLIWIIIILLLLFTPVGFHARVLAGRIFAFEADILGIEDRKTLDTYQWRLVDLEQRALDFDTLQNKVVVVNFWATWCPPCVSELPSFVSLYEDYQDKVAFLFVAKDDTKKVTSFLGKRGYDLPVYFEISQTPEMLESKSIPTTFIIGKSGTINVAEKGAANWNANTTRNLLDTLLSE